MWRSVIKVENLPDVAVGSLVSVGPGGARGVVLQFTRRNTFIGMLDPGVVPERGLQVTTLQRAIAIPGGAGLRGRVIDAIGRPRDGLPHPTGESVRLGGQPAHGGQREVHRTFATGIPVVDLLFPFKTGEVRVIVGPRRSGRSTFALDLLACGASQGWTCVLLDASPAERIAAHRQRLAASGALAQTTVVAAPAEEPPMLRWLSLQAACALVRSAWDRQEQALLVVTDVDALMSAWAELSLALGRPLTRDGAPWDLRQHIGALYEHARSPTMTHAGAITLVLVSEEDSPAGCELTQIAHRAQRTDPEQRALGVYPSLAAHPNNFGDWYHSLSAMRTPFARYVVDRLLYELTAARVADREAREQGEEGDHFARRWRWTTSVLQATPGAPISLDDALLRGFVATRTTGEGLGPEACLPHAAQTVARVLANRSEIALQIASFGKRDDPAPLEKALGGLIASDASAPTQGARSAYRD